MSARRQGRNDRPKVRAKRVLRDRLLRETFQRTDDVRKALAMAGKPRKWASIAAAMGGTWTSESVRDQLNSIVDRRNAIVHEGDYERQERPRTARPIPIEESEATASVDFIADLIDAIHAVIST